MGKNNFSPEQIEILKQNPYTLFVSESRLSVTLEAKEKILEMAEKNWSESKILNELNYDRNMIGHARAKNLIAKVKEEADSRYGLHEGYAKRRPHRMTAAEIAELEENPESYARLKNEVIYLREEVEFLKKIFQQETSGKQNK